MKASCWSCGGGRGRIAPLSRIWRRILCFGNIPLRSASFDHFPEDERDSPVPRQRHTIPPYQQLQDDKFFILSFENRRRSKSTTHTSKSPNSSPISVLQFSADQDSVSSGELGNSKTRRPLDSESQNLVIRRREHHNNDAVKLGGIGYLAAAETVRSTWLHQYHHKHSLLEIGRDVASYIFDHLLEELELELELELILT